jgi:hypothetical protein
MIARWLPLWVAMVSCNAWLLAPTDAASTAGAGATAAADCRVDDDCVLLPELTCCGECPPAPPFQAAPRRVLDGMLVENETSCSYDTRPCPPRACDRVPRGCVARATCEAGRCVVAASGCGAWLAAAAPDRTRGEMSGVVGEAGRGASRARSAAIQPRCTDHCAWGAARRELRR